MTTLLPHLPALQMVLPLMAGPVCLLLRRPGLCWAWALLVSATCLAIAVALFIQVQAVGVVSYHVGAWAPPWGIELRLDALSTLMLVLVSGVGTVVMVYARASVGHEIAFGRRTLFYTLFLLSLAGSLGMCTTGDAFNLFVFLEISSLSTYTLVAQGAGRRALRAAFGYLVLGTVGATFYVIGLGLLYMITGTLNMVDLAARLASADNPRTLIVGAGFLVVGVAIKMALFPLHKWLPGAYAQAPSVVSAFLAATGTKVALYVLLRLCFTVLGPAFSGLHWMPAVTDEGLFLALALVGMISASLSALSQSDLKRLFAYSSVAQIGLMVVGITLVTPEGVTAGLVHLLNHALLKLTLFLALGIVFLRLGSVRLEALAGAGRTMPLTMAALVVAGLSLIGIPGTAGFIGKWLLVAAALERGWWPVALLIVFASLLTLAYVWKIIEVAYFRPAPAERAPGVASPDGGGTRGEAPWAMQLTVLGLAVANIVLGFVTEPTVGTARRAAEALLAGSGS